MGEDNKTGCLGIRPFTLFLFGVLLVLAIFLIGFPIGLGGRFGPQEARRHLLHWNTDHRTSMIWIDGARYIARDLDRDGKVDCLFEAGRIRGDHAYHREGYSKQCGKGVVGRLNRWFGAGKLEPPLGDPLSAAHRLKAQHALSDVSVLDVDGDGRADCVVDMSSYGLIYRANETVCPYLDRSIPEALEDSDLREVLQQLVELEEETRRAFADEG